MDGRSEYSVRVAGVRVVNVAATAAAGDGGSSSSERIELPGAYSPPGIFTTAPSASPGSASGSGGHQAGANPAGSGSASDQSAKSAVVSSKIIPHVIFQYSSILSNKKRG